MADQSLHILELRDAARFVKEGAETGFRIASFDASWNWLAMRLPPAPIRYTATTDGIQLKDPCEVTGSEARGCFVGLVLGWGIVLASVLYWNSMIYPSPVGPIIGWFMVILAVIVLAAYLVRRFRWWAPYNLLVLDQRSGTATITWKRFPGKQHVATTDLTDFAIGVYRLELFEHEARSGALLRNVLEASHLSRKGRLDGAKEKLETGMSAHDHRKVFEGSVAICFAEDLWFALGVGHEPDELLADAKDIARQVPGVRVDFDDQTLIRGIGVRVLRRPRR